jgi:hypothetical protein
MGLPPPSFLKPFLNLNASRGGVLTSPFFPANYPRDLGIEYVITSMDQKSNVQVIFLDFQVSTSSIMEVSTKIFYFIFNYYTKQESKNKLSNILLQLNLCNLTPRETSSKKKFKGHLTFVRLFTVNFSSISTKNTVLPYFELIID